MFGSRLFGQPWWSQFNQLQNEVNRVFDQWGNPRRSPDTPAYPPVNLWEDGEALHLEAELPGFGMEDLEIYVMGNNQLSIKGERKNKTPEKSVPHRQERVFGTFTRVMELPVTVDANRVEARLENGILKLRLAKQEQAKPRKIAVKG